MDAVAQLLVESVAEAVVGGGEALQRAEQLREVRQREAGRVDARGLQRVAHLLDEVARRRGLERRRREREQQRRPWSGLGLGLGLGLG